MQNQTPVCWTGSLETEKTEKRKRASVKLVGNQVEWIQFSVWTAPFIDHILFIRKYQTKVSTNFTLIQSTYRIGQMLHWYQLGNWKRLITTTYPSQFIQVYRWMDLNWKTELKTKFTSRQRMYLFTHVDKINKIWKIERNICQPTLSKQMSLMNK